MNWRARFLAAFILFALGVSSFAGDAGWTVDYDAALERAKMEDRMVLLDFTGSDWCGGCIYLRKNIFASEAFKKFAEDRLVLVELDFPLKKKLPEDLRRQNERLQLKYSAMIFPTLILLDSTGRKKGEIDFARGTPEEFIEKLKAVAEKS